MTILTADYKETFAIVYYDPLQESPRRNGDRYFDKVRLKPGRNNLSESDFSSLKSHSDFDYYIKLKAIEIIEEKVPVEANSSLDTLDANTALQVIKGEYDLEKLKHWQKQELVGKKRKTVLNNLAIQIKDAENGTL
jgi:hypothetical protein